MYSTKNQFYKVQNSKVYLLISLKVAKANKNNLVNLGVVMSIMSIFLKVS